ncbi:MAG: hypothetical protein KME17_18980 [Cyanosarcina radialis HA8281-LM2]|jgi:hypothetical protein|nr:hypothetical protein [Cyanosarcina radialis HA8281-LM2]
MALSRKVFPRSIRSFVVAGAMTLLVVIAGAMTLPLTGPAMSQAAPATPAVRKAAAPILPLFLQSEKAGKASNVYILAMDFDCADPAQEEAFNKWYNEVFIPSELAVPGYQAAWRMRVELPFTRRVKGVADRATYLTAFEIHTDDITAVMKARSYRMQELAADKGPGSLLKEVNAIPYRSMNQIMTRANTPYGPFIPQAKHPATEVDPTGKLKRFMLTVESNAAAPDKEKDFNNWYNTVHVPDVLTSPGYHAAWRLEILSPVAGRGRYMTLYEVHTNNLRVSMDTRDERRIREYMVGAYEGANISPFGQAHYVTLGEKLTKGK